MTKTFNRRQFCAVLGAVSTPAFAQPAGRPIRILVGFGAGGGADIMTRLVAERMSKQLGQTVLVENRPGADGLIAAEAAARSTPDGTTLLFGSNGPLVALPIIRGRSAVPYDVFKDFTPIGQMAQFNMVLVTAPGVQAQTAGEFVKVAQAKPGALNYASANTVARMSSIQFMAQTKIDMTHIAYKGDAAALTDVMADRVEMMFATEAVARPYILDKRIRALMVVGDRRSPTLPDVPTAKEAGFRITVAPWAGLYGPAGIPPATVERLNQALRASLAAPEVQAQMEKLGVQPTPSSPAELAALQRSEYELFSKAVSQDGIKFD